MKQNLQWKLLGIVAVTALAAWGVYPPAEQIRLGLDLSGGAHLVLRVETSDALQVETETAAEQLDEQMSVQGMEAATVIPVDATTDQGRGGRR